MREEEVLYVGMDESNHGETKSRIGEIIVASYSNDYSLWDYKKHPNRRNYARVEECITEKDFDYIFTMISHEKAKRNYSNLHSVAHFLIEEIMNIKETPGKIKLGLDGKLKMKDKKRLLKEGSEKGIGLNVRNFIKENGVHHGPELIYLSHQIANNLINTSMLEIANDSNYVPFYFPE